MTLVLGIQYPFGLLASAISSLHAYLPQTVTLISDSRWTYTSGSTRYEDIGTKLFVLDNSTVIGYSGDVQAGEHCCTQLRTRIQELQRPKSKSVIIITSLLVRVYKYHQKRRKEVPKVLLLMAKYLKNGKTMLVYMESPEFKPSSVTGIKGIGDPKAFDEVSQKIRPQLDKLSIYTGKPTEDTATVAMIIASVMQNRILNNPQYPTVGGPLQIMTIDQKGVHSSEIAYTSDPIGKDDKWHNVTAKNSEITTYKDRQNLSPNFVDVSGFRLHSYCD